MNNEYNNGETMQIWNYAKSFEVTTSSSAARGKKYFVAILQFTPS